MRGLAILALCVGFELSAVPNRRFLSAGTLGAFVGTRMTFAEPASLREFNQGELYKNCITAEDKKECKSSYYRTFNQLVEKEFRQKLYDIDQEFGNFLTEVDQEKEWRELLKKEEGFFQESDYPEPFVHCDNLDRKITFFRDLLYSLVYSLDNRQEDQADIDTAEKYVNKISKILRGFEYVRLDLIFHYALSDKYLNKFEAIVNKVRKEFIDQYFDLHTSYWLGSWIETQPSLGWQLSDFKFTMSSLLNMQAVMTSPTQGINSKDEIAKWHQFSQMLNARSVIAERFSNENRVPDSSYFALRDWTDIMSIISVIGDRCEIDEHCIKYNFKERKVCLKSAKVCSICDPVKNDYQALRNPSCSDVNRLCNPGASPEENSCEVCSYIEGKSNGCENDEVCANGKCGKCFREAGTKLEVDVGCSPEEPVCLMDGQDPMQYQCVQCISWNAPNDARKSFGCRLPELPCINLEDGKSQCANCTLDEKGDEHGCPSKEELGTVCLVAPNDEVEKNRCVECIPWLEVDARHMIGSPHPGCNELKPFCNSLADEASKCETCLPNGKSCDKEKPLCLIKYEGNKFDRICAVCAPQPENKGQNLPHLGCPDKQVCEVDFKYQTSSCKQCMAPLEYNFIYKRGDPHPGCSKEEPVCENQACGLCLKSGVNGRTKDAPCQIHMCVKEIDNQRKSVACDRQRMCVIGFDKQNRCMDCIQDLQGSVGCDDPSLTCSEEVSGGTCAKCSKTYGCKGDTPVCKIDGQYAFRNKCVVCMKGPEGSTADIGCSDPNKPLCHTTNNDDMNSCHPLPKEKNSAKALLVK